MPIVLVKIKMAAALANFQRGAGPVAFRAMTSPSVAVVAIGRAGYRCDPYNNRGLHVQR